MGKIRGFFEGIPKIVTAGYENHPGKNTLAVILIALAAAVLYANTLGNGFVMDDQIVVKDNSFIASWSNLRFLCDPSVYFNASGERTWRPLATISYFCDRAIWGYAPLGYHLTNLLIHLMNGVLVYFIMSGFLPHAGAAKSAPGEKNDEKYLIPLFTALFFVSHPVQTEGVNFVGGRHDLVMAFFFLVSLLSYRISVSGKKTGMGIYLFSLAAYLFSCLSKENGIMLPAVAVMMDIFTRPASGEKGYWKKRSVLYAGFALTALLFTYLRFFVVTYTGEKLALGASRFPAIGGIFLTYLRLLLFPLRLSAEYVAGEGYLQKIPASFLEPEAYVPAIIVILAAAAIFALRRRFPMLFFGAAWFFITLFPASNIPYQLTSFPLREKYIYLPFAGFCVALSCGLYRIACLLAGSSGRKRAMIFFAIGAVLLGAYSVRTVHRNVDWKDGVSLWSATLKTSPGSYRAYYNLGMSYLAERGDTEKAIEAFNRSLESYDFPMTHDALAMVYMKKGLYDKALGELKIANKGAPSLGSVYYNLGLVYIELGEYDKAMDAAKEGLSKVKRSFETHYTPVPEADLHYIMGVVFFAKKDHDSAVRAFETGLSIRPGDPKILYFLGKAYTQNRLYENAVKAFGEALNAAPYDIPIRYAMANAFLKMKMFDRAEKEYREILRIDPAHADSRNNLANIYYSQGFSEKAVAEYRKILETDPSHFRARNNLANMYLMSGRFNEAIEEYQKVLEAQPTNSAAHYNLGLAYNSKGMTAEARREWQKVLFVDPGFTQAAEALKRIDDGKNGGI